MAQDEIVSLLVGDGDTSVESFVTATKLEVPLRRPTEPMLPLAIHVWFRLILGKENCKRLLVLFFARLAIITAIRIDNHIAEILTTESADKLVLFEFSSVPIYELGPFVHLMSSFLVEFLLIKVILLLKFLRQFPDHIVFKFK